MRVKFRIISGSLIVVFFLLSLLNAYPQDKITTVVYRYKKQDQTLPSYWFDIYKPLPEIPYGNVTTFPRISLLQLSTKDSSETKCTFLISDTTCATIADLFMQEIIVIPGDSIVISIASESNKSKLAGKFTRPWEHDVQFSGKNKFIYSLFDSLANFEGDLRFNSKVKYSRTSLNLDSFCNAVNERYLHRLEFTDQYCSRHKIPSKIKELVNTEINSSYFANLITPLSNPKINLNKYPEEYANQIRRRKSGDAHFYFKTVLYSQVATALIKYQDKEDSGPTFTREKLKNRYNWIKQNYKGDIRENQLIDHIQQYSRHYSDFPETIDSVVNDFINFAENKRYLRHLDSCIIASKIKKEIVYTLAQVMASEIGDTANNHKTIQSLFNHKPTVMICWASWCKPCLAEFPAEEMLERKYGDKIDFVYLSFDQNKLAWKEKSKEMKLRQNNNFLLSSGFKSVISNFYKFSSIPQYLVYDRQGQKIDIDDVRPSERKFKMILDDLIK